MFKKLLSTMTALCMILGTAAALPEGIADDFVSTIKAQAANTIDSGYCGNNLTWTLDDEGTLTISGNGKMKDYGFDDNSWYPKSKNIKKVVINNGVTSIGGGAFDWYQNLTSITIPNSVTSIGYRAFYGCKSLTSITIPNSVTSIGYCAFYGCKSLTSITIPSGVTSIDDHAFTNCTSLKNITIPDGVTSIDDDAFSGCISLTSINVGNNNSKYSSIDGVLYNKSKTELIYCPEGKISITIPDSVTSIGSYAFSDCTSLTNITIPDSVTSIDDHAFYYCRSLTSITIPDSVTSIGDDAFYDCTSLTSITIPDSVTSIGSYAFSYCTHLTSITIPDSVTSIGSCAFSSCTNLTSITIPNSVTSIDYDAFSWCTSLTSITIPNSVTSIGDDAFYDCTSLTSITIPDSVTSIGNEAFRGCTSLTSITIPNSVTSIGDRAFYGCTSLTIKCNSGSVAEKYAKENNIKYELLDKTTKSIADCTLSLSQTSYTYDGTAKKPTVTVKDGSKTLTNGTDYTVSYSNNTAVGTAKVTVTGKGNYTGSVSKSYTITKAPETKTDISNCTITLSQTIYTYDGNAKKPTVTVKYGSKTLTNGTDYTVTYSNNTAVGTAKATVTGKGNYTGSISKTFNISEKPSTSKSFKWGRDNWNFTNSSYDGSFLSGTYRSQISSDYQKVLINNLTNSEYQAVFKGTWFTRAWLDEYFNGSCYGMSSTTFLSKAGLLPYASYKSGATMLNDLNAPAKNKNISSLITYYQMLQIKDDIQQQYRKVPNRSNKDNINNIISLLDKNSVVLIGFKKAGWGGHAILAYGYEYGSYTYNGVTYQGCINICDPNSSNKYDKTYNIYFNTSTYNWAIPAYNSGGVSSSKGAVFNYIGADISEINNGGYLSGKKTKNKETYVARIDAAAISNNRSVSKVVESNGSFITQNNAPGDIVEDYSYILGGESKGTAGYNLYDSNAAYKVSQDTPTELKLSINYEDCRLTGGSAAGNNVVFDNDGSVWVDADSADYNISMSFDEDFPTDWFAIEVNGSGANKAQLKKANNGYVIVSDNLKNVNVSVNNKTDSAKTVFSTSYPSALIYEINKNTIGVKVDTDNNGTYETEIKTGNNNISKATITGISAKTYTGKAITQSPVVKLGTKTLKSGTDYTVAYKNNTKVGTATVTITGKGSYTGTISKTFKINAASISKATVSGISNKTYTGKAITQNPTVKLGSKTLKKGTDYTVTFKNNKAVGKATVTIKGKGNYTGTISKTFKINPKKTTLKTATSPKTKKLKVTYSKVSGVTGYQTVYSTSSKFTKATTKTASSKSTSKTISGLTKGKTYYVKVRTYKTVNGTKYYSGYSAVKKVKIK